MRSPLGALASLANKAPVPYVSRAATQGQPWWRPGGVESQMRAMGGVGTLFAIVERLATSTAAVEWKLFRTARPDQRPEDREEVTRHLALEVWNRPNQFFTRALFVETGQQHFDLVGEQWWVVARDRRAPWPMELWPVRPDRMQPIPDPENYLAGYMYMAPDGQQVPLRLDEVIQIRRPNPVDPYRGFGPVQTILADLEGVRLSSEWNRNFFLNDASPGGIIEVERRLGDEEFDEMVDRWREQHQGTANAHRVALIENGAKWVERNYTRKDMQFTEMRSVSSAVIREAFGIPKFAIGDVDDVNRATADASKAWFAEQLTVPRLERIKQALNTQFLPMFGATGQGIEFDYVSPVPADRDADNNELGARSTAVKTLIEAQLPAAYALEVAGLPEVPAEMLVAEPEEPEPDPGDGAEPQEPEDVTQARTVAELVPKLTPGVDTVLTYEEARAILAQAGADIDPAAEKPEAPAPPVPPAPPGQPEEPAEPGPGEEQPPGEQPDDAPPPPGEEEEPEPPTPPANALQARLRRLRAAADDGKDVDPEDLPDVTPLGDQLAKALDRLLDAWGPISDAQKDALVQQVKDAAADGDLTELNDLHPPTDDAEEALTDAMVAIAAQAADQAVDEAADQDVKIEPAEPDRSTLADIAKVVAAGMAADLATSAAREALRISGEKSAAEIADGVRDHLGSLTDAQPKQRLGGALHTAQHQGRAATFDKAAQEMKGSKAAPSPAYYGSEKLDSNTCKPCRDIDGKWLGNELADAQRDYPNGTYERCEGRDRCRGHVVVVWRGGSDRSKWREKEPA